MVFAQYGVHSATLHEAVPAGRPGCPAPVRLVLCRCVRLTLTRPICAFSGSLGGLSSFPFNELGPLLPTSK